MKLLGRIDVGAILAAATPLAAQGPTGFAERVDAYVRQQMTEQQLVGLSLTVIREGRIVLERGYGFANVEHRVPATAATVYQSGSVGKQFTAAGIMLLVQDGKLRLDDPVTRFFSDAAEAWRDVTIRHLLTHTSGAGDYPDDFDYRHDLHRRGDAQAHLLPPLCVPTRRGMGVQQHGICVARHHHPAGDGSVLR